MAIVLFTSYYSEQNIIRKRELDYILANNIMNKLISKIVLVCDDTVPEHVTFDFEKVVMVRLDRRPSFADFFYQIAPKYSTEDDIKLFANSDIHFDDTLRHLDFIQWEKEIALCLSRWDKNEEGKWTLYPTWDSQDVWVLKGTIKPMFANFYLGKPGSDNRLMYEMDKAGYWVFNPSKDIHCFHVHNSGVRTYDEKSGSDSVPSPYKLMHPHDFSSIKMNTPKKIFHLGLYSFFAERAIGDSLSEIGEYKFLNWQNYTKGDWKIMSEKREEFEKIVLKLTEWADVVFCQLQTPNIVTKELAIKMNQCNPNVKIYNWTGDVRNPIPLEIIEIAPYVTTLFTNDTDVKTLKEKNLRSEYLQIGYPENIYNPKGNQAKAPEIVFMANNYYDTKKGQHQFPNGKARQDMVMFLKETYGDNFGVYGRGWSGLEEADYVNDAIKEASVYRGAKIAINYSHFDYSRYSSDRVLRIMGCGCFCITHKFPDMEKDYKVGEHLASFESFDQLKKEIDYFLANDVDRMRIAKQGCEYVQRTCTWNVRLKNLLK